MKLTLAYANFRFTPDAYYNSCKLDTINPTTILKVDELKNLYKEIKTKLEFIRKRIKKYYNTKRIKRLTFKEGEIVYLAAKNI